MKRIVICCDGTWQGLGQSEPTNVAHTALAVLPRGTGGVEQIVAHLDGVGVGGGQTAFGATFDRYVGGATGLGLDRGMAAAYRFLVFNYSPGDEIYLFGYSRGAFTARSLAGLIRQSGILARTNASRIGEALRLYRNRDKDLGPKEPASLRFRATYSPAVALGDDEIQWRRDNLKDRDWSRVHKLTIRYIGVWDTVGALGVPGLFGDEPFFKHKYQFHDANLSSHVEAARHAVAVDERRPAFKPTLWDNLDRLNGPLAGERAFYQQRWFPGIHGAVGGGGQDRKLSDLALAWVLDGAAAMGLDLDPAFTARIAQSGDPLGPLRPGPAGGPLAALTDRFARDREGPASGEADALSTVVRARWQGDPTYRPPTLSRVRALLDAPAPHPASPAPAPQPVTS